MLTIRPRIFLAILTVALPLAVVGGRAFADAPTVGGAVATPTPAPGATGAKTPKPAHSESPAPIFTTAAIAVSGKYVAPTPKPTRTPTPKPTHSATPRPTEKPGTPKPEETEAAAHPGDVKDVPVAKFAIPFTATKLVRLIKVETQRQTSTGVAEGPKETEYRAIRWYMTCAVTGHSKADPTKDSQLAYGDVMVTLDPKGDFNAGAPGTVLVPVFAVRLGSVTSYKCELTPGSPVADEQGLMVGHSSTAVSEAQAMLDAVSPITGSRSVSGNKAFTIK
jgi:hypothetical protein